MAERNNLKKKSLGRSASTESTEYSASIGRSVKRKKPKERWLLSRKTWRYMADAGRKLIPDGAQNRTEDIPKIEAYFQEVCKREPKFLLCRKNSYPGALGFRKKRKQSRKGGSCRKAGSADEVDNIKLERPNLLCQRTTVGKFDLKKMKEDFFNVPSTRTNFSTSFDPTKTQEHVNGNKQEENQLVNMLEQYLHLADKPEAKITVDFNYQDLVDKLQRHLALSTASHRYYKEYTPVTSRHQQFEGDYVQRTLSETLSRYFGQSTNRDKVISDLLTDRKALEKLYFELRKAKGFRGSRGGTGYTTSLPYNLSSSNTYGRALATRDGYSRISGTSSPSHPPPLIEVESETLEITVRQFGTQTLPVPECVLLECEKEYRKALAEEEEEENKEQKSFRRRSSVDNDDVSQSVSDTIKRYLRMARKKSVDTDKADRFKRVNYDRNLRNIKAKGEITKPGDDDGLNKGCQTNDDWILKYRDLKFIDVYDISDVESRISSARSSVDIGVINDGLKSSPSSPPAKSGSQSFLSQLLYGKHDKHDKHSAAVTAAAMQKSKSSSSVIQQGSKLMTKKIFRSRSKSQTRPSQTSCSWTPQGSCVWNHITGRQVILSDTNLLQLTEVERKVLQKVAIAKLQALNLGVSVKVPSETIGSTPSKPKRRPYLIKKKSLTTSIFDTARKDAEKDGSSSNGLVFGIPLTQCVENDRLSRVATGIPLFRCAADDEEGGMRRHGSRASFSSLIDTPRSDEIGSCESLMGRERIMGSVPGLLDRISYSSATDIPGSIPDDESTVPNILLECIRHLEQHGLHTLGIFRVSTSKKRIRQLREDFDCGKETSLDDEQCPHDVATLLKEFLRDLPDPLLCRDLYHAFVQTQKIRNRRLQLEALQHLVQLLPTINRDTLYYLLAFLANVAKNSGDFKNALGENIEGNKMDSNNLATVFAPNILHCVKPGAKESTDRIEDRIDVINVIRSLIDNFKQLYVVSAELLDEVYAHMADKYPEILEQLLNKKEAITAADESVEELDSECNSAPWSPTMPTSEVSMDNAFDIKSFTEPKRTYSREEFLHETAATGGPNVGMRVRHKDRIRERSMRRKRERNEDGQSSSAKGIISRLRGQKDDDTDYLKTRSSSIESTDSDVTRVLRASDNHERRKSSPYVLDNSGVITASLTIPVQNMSYNIDDDIPYIEEGDDTRKQFTIGVIKSPSVPVRRRNYSIGSDSSVASNLQPMTGSLSLVQSVDSALGSSMTYSTPVQNTPTSVTSSVANPCILSSPSSWASSPPTSPDSMHTSVNYIPDDVQHPRVKIKNSNIAKENPVLQKVSFASTQEVQNINPIKEVPEVYKRELSFTKDTKPATGALELNKSSSISAFETLKSGVREGFTQSITNIGSAVLKSKTADFERIIKVESKPKCSGTVATASSVADRDKKKYTKRRYTDSRHPTRHIPDAEALESSSSANSKDQTNLAQVVPVYKRKELISSVPTK